MRRATTSLVTCAFCWTFQSTLSMRRATVAAWINAYGRRISIHALHEESDFLAACYNNQV